jgi:hypothetical protein
MSVNNNGSDDGIVLRRGDNNAAMRRNLEQLNLLKARIDEYNRNYYECVYEIVDTFERIRLLGSQWNNHRETTFGNLFREVERFDAEFDRQRQDIQIGHHENRAEYLVEGLNEQYQEKLRLSNDLKALRSMLYHKTHVSEDWRLMIRDAEAEMQRLRETMTQ